VNQNAIEPAGSASAAPSVFGPTGTGLDPRVAAALSYLVGWFTGVLFLMLERENRYVRFHAMQSLVGLGGLFVVWAGLLMLSAMVMFFSAAMFRVLFWGAMLAWIASLIVWLICMVKAYLGEVWKLPIAGEIAERLIARQSAAAR
jgi:uncharacterized membrane protein